MRRSRLPLTALRTFESAGRLGSFTRAAEELYVSQAAVSRQVRELETDLGKPLFVRHHRSVSLTGEGRTLLEILTGAFDAMEESLLKIRGEEGGRMLEISAEPYFAAVCLMPRLADFERAHPDIDISILSDTQLNAFRPGDPEIAIRYGRYRSTWPGTDARRLIELNLVPAIAPALLASGPLVRGPADIAAHTILHEDDCVTWDRWFAAAGLPSRPEGRTRIFSEGSLVMQAALRGHGVALVDKRLVAEDLAAGRLVQLSDLSIAEGAYYLVTGSKARLSAQAHAFRTWLLGQFGCGDEV